MGSLESKNIEIIESKIPVEWFIAFLRSWVNQQISKETFQDLKNKYETLEYNTFIEKFFSTFGKYISCYADEYQNIFLEYIEKNFSSGVNKQKNFFEDISQKIWDIIDNTSRYKWKKISQEDKKEIIEKTDNLMALYDEFDEKFDINNRQQELESIKKYISWRNYPSENTAKLFLEKLEEYENEIKKTV